MSRLPLPEPEEGDKVPGYKLRAESQQDDRKNRHGPFGANPGLIRAKCTEWETHSADAWKLLANKHVHEASPADLGFHVYTGFPF